MATAEQLQTLTSKAIQAIERHYAKDPEPIRGGARASNDVRYLVGRCLDEGITLQRLADCARVPGHLLLQFVDDAQRKADAYTAEIHRLERTLDTVRRDRAHLAVVRVRDGEQKTAVAASFGVSRPTLDAWIANADERYRAEISRR